MALVREGRIGKVKRVSCAIGGAPSGGPFKKGTPPVPKQALREAKLTQEALKR